MGTPVFRVYLQGAMNVNYFNDILFISSVFFFTNAVTMQIVIGIQVISHPDNESLKTVENAARVSHFFCRRVQSVN